MIRLPLALCIVLPCLILPAPTHAQLPYDHDYFTLRDGLQNSGLALKGNSTARVAFLGGSITRMQGWRDLACADLAARFPDTEFDFVQAGIPSMGSTPGAFRLHRDVLSKGPVDLLFVEAAVNDSTNARTPAQIVRGMEGIVRQARLFNPKMDIVMMHFVDPGKVEAYNRGEVPEVIQLHEKVAVQYGVPSLNLALEVTERIRAGEFTWEKDFKDLHPAPFGHEVYRASIRRMLDAAWANVAGGPQPHALPEPPLDIFSYANPRIVSISEARALQGFALLDSWKPDDGTGTREGFTEVPMLAAETPGASLALTFEGTAVGLWVAAGQDAGTIEYSLDEGPFLEQDLFTQWSKSLHLPWAYVLADELAPGPHTLRLRIAESANPASSGHAVRIAHFLVNRPAAE